jgi:hypothetical protein
MRGRVEKPVGDDYTADDSRSSRFASGFGFVAKLFLQMPHEHESGWVVPAMAFAATLIGMTLAICSLPTSRE